MESWRKFNRLRNKYAMTLILFFLGMFGFIGIISTPEAMTSLDENSQPFLNWQVDVAQSKLAKLSKNNNLLKLKQKEEILRFEPVRDFFMPEIYPVAINGLPELPKNFLKNNEEKRRKNKYLIQPRRIVGEYGLLAIRKYQGNTWLGTFMKGAIVFMVHSMSRHDRRRSLIRSTWGSIRDIDGWKLEVVFIVGLSKSIEEQAKLRKESSTHGDILQYEGSDYSSSETLKVLAGLQWASDYLPGDVYYASSTDDCAVNIAAVRDFIAEQTSFPITVYDKVYHMISKDWSSVTAPQPQYIYCFEKYSESEIINYRLNFTKSVSSETYEADVWPPYCTEGLYIFPVSLGLELHNLSLVTNLSLPYSLHDVFVTGILRRKLNYGDENISKATRADLRKTPLLRLQLLPISSDAEHARYELEAEDKFVSAWNNWYEDIRYRYHIYSSASEF